MTHPLLVVSNQPYPVLVGTDILLAHQATVSFENGCSLQLRAGVCNVCLYLRVDSDLEPPERACCRNSSDIEYADCCAEPGYQ